MALTGLKFLAISAVMALLAGCRGAPAPPPRRSESVPVSVARVARKAVPVEVRAIGNAEAISTISVKSQVGGELTRVHFAEGDFVRKGQILFTIDQRPLQAQVAQVEANLARDKAQLAQAQANLARDEAQAKYAEAQFGRMAKLAEQGVISRENLDQARADADARSAAVRADQAAIESARAAIQADLAALENARIQLGYTTIASPIDGRTGNLNAKQGNLVKANDLELVAINQVSPIYVAFAVPEAQLGEIKRHMAGRKLEVMAAPQEEGAARETGVLTFVDNAVDRATGTIRLRGTFANNARGLWPGQFVEVTLRLATQGDALVVPSESIQTGQQGQYVFVVKPDMTVESRAVQPGIRTEREVVIDRGLEAARA